MNDLDNHQTLVRADLRRPRLANHITLTTRRIHIEATCVIPTQPILLMTRVKRAQPWRTNEILSDHNIADKIFGHVEIVVKSTTAQLHSKLNDVQNWQSLI